jgi:hypothetical protein
MLASTIVIEEAGGEIVGFRETASETTSDKKQSLTEEMIRRMARAADGHLLIL